jgi:hypothetical protein
MTKDWPDWNMEKYTQQEGDEHLDWETEFLPLIKNDPVYFTRYELDFVPWEYGEVDRQERLLKIDELELDRKLYPDYGYGQADLLRAICDDSLDHVIAACGGRSGKTLTYFAASMCNLFQRPWNLKNPPRSPMSVLIGSYRQDHAILVIMAEIKSRLQYTKNIKNYLVGKGSKKGSKTMVEFAQNLRLYTLPMSEVSHIQGQTNAIRVMVDEASRIRDPMIFPTIERMLTEKTVVQLADASWYKYGVQMVLTSTPEGMVDEFAQEFHNASQQHIPGYKAIRWHSFDSPYYDHVKGLNLLLKPNARELWWRQEFGAEFLHISNNFFGPEVLDKNIKDDIGEWGNDSPSSRPLHWGIDWGEARDSTVIWVNEDLGGPRVRTKFIKEFIKTKYDEQKDYIVNLAERLKPKIVKADDNQRALNTILANDYKLPLIPVTGVSMNLQAKHHMFNQTLYMLQAGLVDCPPNRKWYEQMIGIVVKETPAGYQSFSGKKTVGFDDFVDAFVLCNSCKSVYGVYSPKHSIQRREPMGKRDWSKYKPRSKVQKKATDVYDRMERERKISKRGDRRR